MEEWKEYKLRDVLTIKYGKDHKQIADGVIPIYGSGGIMRYGERSLYEGPSILIPRKGSLNNIMYSDKPFWTVDTMFWTIINEEIANPLFVYYSICKKDFASLNVGSAVPSLTVPVIEDVDILLPSKFSQDKIVAILKSLDDKIENNRRINENLEQQAQALFKSWFVDFEPFKDQPFVDSELGMIPKGWKILSLNEVCLKVTDGSHYSPKDDPLGNIPMLSVKDMQHNGFDYSSCKKINEEEYNKMKANDCVPLKNDILVAKDGSYLKEIFLCMQEVKQAILSSIALFRCNLDVIYPEILLQLLRLPTIRKDVGDNYVSGSALPRIVLKDFKKFRFVVAPINIQNKIINTLHSLCLQIYNNDQESRRLAELRDTLLPRLMSGEIDVNEI
jgi:type I restriction enzyme S subunit